MSSDDTREMIEILAEEYVELLRQGERPDIEEFAAQHPNLADRIRSLFPTLQLLEGVKPASDSHTSCSEHSDSHARFDTGLKKNTVIGEYRIVGEIGRGGMGIVYEAIQEPLGRRVAVKLLNAPMLSSESAVLRFKREAQAAANLHHTNIVPVFDIGEQQGRHYYVMQYIEGTGLDRLISVMSGVCKKTQRSQRKSPAPDTAATAIDSAEPVADGMSDDSEAVGERTIAVSDETIERPYAPEDKPSSVADAQPAASCETGSETVVLSRSADVSSDGSGSPVGASDSASPCRSFFQLLQQLDSKLDGRGKSLRNATFEERRKYYRMVAHIALQAANAIDYAHRQGTLHRDIKPGNLILDEQGNVWVLDFGLAKLDGEDDLTKSGDIIGTLRYLAPEQLEGKADAQSDICSLGLTMYELLTLQPAYTGRTYHQLLKEISHESPEPLRNIDRAIPRDLETIVMKAVARNPKDRYATSCEFADDLQRFLEDRPIEARRSTPLERAVRWCRRNPAIASLGSAAILLLLTLAAVMSGAYYHTSKALEGESQQHQLAIEATERANANLELAMEAFGDLFSELSGSPVSTNTGAEQFGMETLSPSAVIEPDDAELLQRLAEFYEQFIERNSGDSLLYLQTARAYRQLGEIHQRQGNRETAREYFGQAISAYEPALTQTETPTLIRLEMAYAHNRLAHEHGPKPETYEEALVHLEQARRLLTAPDNSPKFEDAILVELIQNTWLTGAAMVEQCRFGEEHSSDDARRYFDQAIALIGQLPAHERQTTTIRLTEAQIHGVMWTDVFQDGDFEEAMRMREKGIALLRDLSDTYPDNHEYRANYLAAMLMPPTGYGRAVLTGKQFAASNEADRKRLRSDMQHAFEEADRCRQEWNYVPSYLMLTLVSGLHMGDAHFRDGDFGLASEGYRRCLALIDEEAGRRPDRRPTPGPMRLILNLRLAATHLQNHERIANAETEPDSAADHLQQAELAVRRAHALLDQFVAERFDNAIIDYYETILADLVRALENADLNAKADALSTELAPPRETHPERNSE